MAETSNPDSLNAAPYELFMLGLSLYVVLAMASESFLPIDAGSKSILQIADSGICVVFLGDFVRNVWKSQDKIRYLITWGWLDLVSSIPMVGPARFGRAARVVRIFRVLRGFRSVRNLTEFLLRRRAQAAFAAAALISIMLVIFSAVAVLEFERGFDGANIKTPQDALWWAYVTITTVGYGDRFPLSSEGRIVAAVLMTAGVGLFGTFTGFVASWFLSPRAKEDHGPPVP